MKNEYVIAIPSKDRPDIISERTLKLIGDLDNIYIFIEPQDYDKYKHLNNNINIIELPENNRGIAYSRYYIQEYFRNKIRYIWQLDDDLEQFAVRKGLTSGGHPKLVLIKNENITVGQIFEEVLKIMKEKKYIQMTISYRPTNWYYNGLIKELVMANGVVLNDNQQMLENNILYDLEIDLYEDVDLSAQLLQKRFKNACFYKYAFCTKMAHYKGGCNIYRTKEGLDKVYKHLKKKYGNFVRPILDKKYNAITPHIKWKNLYMNEKNSLLKYTT